MLILVGLLALIAIGIGTMLVNLSEGEGTISAISFWLGLIIIIASIYFFLMAMFFPEMITLIK